MSERTNMKTIAIAFTLMAATLMAQTNETIKDSYANLSYICVSNMVFAKNVISKGMSCYVNQDDELRLNAGGKLTEIMESVEIVTNVVHWDDEERSPLRFEWFVGEPMPGSIIKEATQKTETITVVEIKTLHFKWEGVEREVKNERVLLNKVKRWKKSTEWVEE
ncbi:MAG TPA: hypothetical protein PKW18_13085 [Candidatus Sumerlaeota bacterium]|nr:hypothetical protein [Candidatus Sumerlaeota bacterium]